MIENNLLDISCHLREPFNDTVRLARFSDCGAYRYYLCEVWDPSKPMIAFIGLNPSTATQAKNDPTIGRVQSFAKRWRYGGFYMLNLFAVVSADPKILKTCPDPQKENDLYLQSLQRLGVDVAFAWGNFKEARERCNEIFTMFPQATCVGINKNGSPKHPLYVPGKISQINYS